MKVSRKNQSLINLIEAYPHAVTIRPAVVDCTVQEYLDGGHSEKFLCVVQDQHGGCRVYKRDSLNSYLKWDGNAPIFLVNQDTINNLPKADLDFNVQDPEWQGYAASLNYFDDHFDGPLNENSPIIANGWWFDNYPSKRIFKMESMSY
jgi:hypothetical protein